MTILTALYVALGAAVGAPARYLADRALQSTHGTSFPWGTFTVNVSASLILGIVLGGTLPTAITAAVGIGFCGGLSTWSTLGYETVRLNEEGARSSSVINVVMSSFAGLGAVTLGIAIGHTL